MFLSKAFDKDQLCQRQNTLQFLSITAMKLHEFVSTLCYSAANFLGTGRLVRKKYAGRTFRAD